MPRIITEQLDHMRYQITPKVIYGNEYIVLRDDMEVERFGRPGYMEWYVCPGTYAIEQWLRQDTKHNFVALILKQKKKKVIKFTEIRRDTITNRGEYYNNEMVIYYTYHNNTSHDTPVSVYKREEVEE